MKTLSTILFFLLILSSCKKESKKGCNGKATKCLTHNLWDELENHINNFFDKKSLEDLVKDNSERRV